ncbi:NAD/NADP octopine/nopaline dehydrogenase family protein [Thalassospira mesophila]|uniref:NAD/NADP octopine/nopaline dehydrogenase n=1 Tax=Thalassospira mesophila TaxID=1293891 RepID=A0A1Y2KYA4_9PROT|nr:NAD/NADP octopine/nopaline dehydrogenase family protein [Thalassospira mesophila]OSQ37400.1 NAD/NADP octopine/nopaline dehydrogenase [Thalassospira mesophila]
MHVGIVGAGLVARGYFAFLTQRGMTPEMWSPSGKSAQLVPADAPLTVSGAIEGSFNLAYCTSANELAQNDIIILALPANGHRMVLDVIIPCLEARHTLIMSGHLSFAALYLSKKLAEREVQIPIVVWSTTALTAKSPHVATELRIGALRSNVDMAVIPAEGGEQAKDLCVALFGDRFTLQDDLLTIALSNLNPQSHLAIALCNLTRIEKGELWHQNTNMTDKVGNFLEALDGERLAIAKAFGKQMRSQLENFCLASGLKPKSTSDLYQMQVARGTDPIGPKDITTRYVLEDVPFGLVPTLYLARLAGVDAPLHQAGAAILAACYKRDFKQDNNLLDVLAINDIATLKRLVRDGFKRD